MSTRIVRALEKLMLNFEQSGFDDPAAANLEATRARSLADDMDSLLAGTFPFRDRLAKAPLIERWKVVAARVPVLHGVAINHPSASGPISVFTTAPLVVAAEGQRWIRCGEGFWRLGGIEDGQHFPWNEPSLHLREWT